MKLALEQAKKNLGNTKENPAVGCVITKNDLVIAAGATNINGRPHAEHNAILFSKVKLVDNNQGIKIDLNRLPLDDHNTFDLLSSGKTTDIFQLESSGMQRYIKELKPSNLGDIAAMIALYRPGPMEHITSFIDGKHGRIPISYPHDSLRELLDETYGIIVYQDQVLLILQGFAGYSLGEADIVRKAMGKKSSSLMAQERDKFVKGAQNKGFTEHLAVEVFDLIEPFAGYAFNKAHSVSYALISYWTAYFKTHYPVEYMTSVLNSRLDNTERMVSSINECFKLNIPVLLPDINHSEEFFTIDKNTSSNPVIRFGLSAIKNVGESAVSPIVEERQINGAFKSIDDFCQRADVSSVNRRTLESLARAGTFDSLGPRGPILTSIEQIVASAQLATRTRNSGQTSMFDSMSMANSSATVAGISLSGPDMTDQEKSEQEIEYIGLSLSYNPLIKLARLTDEGYITNLENLEQSPQDQNLTFLGHVSNVSERYTKEQKKFLLVNLDLLGGPVEVVVWPDILDRTQSEWVAGRLVRIIGKLRWRGDQYSIVCNQAEEFSADIENISQSNSQHSPETPSPKGRNPNVPQKASNTLGRNDQAPIKDTGKGVSEPRTVALKIKESSDAVEDAYLLREVVQVLLEYPGKDRVNLQIQTGGKQVVMELPVISTGYTEEMKSRLEILLGLNSVDLQSHHLMSEDSIPV